MNVYVTGFEPGKKIRAIKAIRQSTGLDLKASKNVADRVEAGEHVEIALAHVDHTQWLDQEGVAYKPVPVEVTLKGLLDVLGYYPPEMTVGDVVRVLRAAYTHQPSDAS